jgi:hypothetical protein
MRAEPGEDPIDELLFDWDRYQAQAIDWEQHEAQFQAHWERKYAKGPSWGKISDYHRYGYAGRRLYPDDPRDDVIHRIRRGFERGDWDTRDPWPLIEAAIREGWEEAARDG